MLRGIYLQKMHGSQSTPALGWESKTLRLSIPLRTTAAGSGERGEIFSSKMNAR